jgi:AraC-like DNA-binding protein
LSTQEIRAKQDERLDKVFQFTIDNFREPVRLSQVASIACMSIPSFCEYFKRSTKKTYIDFLNEVRIGYACNLLLDSTCSVQDICFASGYNTVANFHKQFIKIKEMTPLQFRKNFAANMASNHKTTAEKSPASKSRNSQF